MNELSTILISALTTLLIAVVAATLGARLQANREQANWLREQRYKVCLTMLRSIDWRDLGQKVDAEPPKALPAPADLYAELDVLGLDRVVDAARRCGDALYRLEYDLRPVDEFDSDTYRGLQAEFDRTRRQYVEAVRAALGIRAI